MKKYGFYFLSFLSGVLIILSISSLFYESTYWWLKVLNFPRIQFFLIGLFLLLILLIFFRKFKGIMFLSFGLIGAIVLHATFLLPYTPLVPKEVPDARQEGESLQGYPFSLLVANVYMHNRKPDELLQLINSSNSDIVLLMETNDWWQTQLEPVRNKYPHHIEHPLGNTYGMMLYSHYPLVNSKVLFLENPNVPSIHTTVQLPNGLSFNFHGMHPVPPVPSKKYPDNMNERAGALDEVSAITINSKLPVIVAGDFNDVIWSNSTKNFKKRSKLNDVRVGRGFYNSFNAFSPVMRWMLDHVYVSYHFSLMELERLPQFGSDHFPIFTKLLLNPVATQVVPVK